MTTRNAPGKGAATPLAEVEGKEVSSRFHQKYVQSTPPTVATGSSYKGGSIAESSFPHSDVPSYRRGHAKAMRRRPIQAEQRLWRALKAHRLEGLGFRRQVPMGNYIADFVCHRARLVVEVDGETHSTGSEIRRDRVRDAWFASRGHTTPRFWNDGTSRDLDSVLVSIRAACEGRVASLPNPPPQGGREAETAS